MSNPLHAAFYADQACQLSVLIRENERLARDTYRLRIECPELAARIVPGQFLMLRIADGYDPLIGRPLALYDTYRGAGDQPQGVDVVYLVKGRFTTRLAHCLPGQRLEAWGPLGNGFANRPVDNLILVAGGIGQTPFLAVTKEARGRQAYGQPPRSTNYARRVVFCYGARSAEYFAGLEEFQQAGAELRLATDDGSAGLHGLVTRQLEATLQEIPEPRRILCCGPEPMMEAVAEIARLHQVECQVSLETPMACGIGICFTCVAKVRQPDGSWDYKRTCVEGPVFDSRDVVW